MWCFPSFILILDFLPVIMDGMLNDGVAYKARYHVDDLSFSH